MNYFDDIKITFVGKVTTDVVNPPSSAIHNLYGLGLMLGDGYVRYITYPDHETYIKMPFLYIISPITTGCAWQSVNGSKRDNRWFVFEGPRAERMIAALAEEMSGETKAIHLKNYSDLIMYHQKMHELFQSNIPATYHQLAVCAENFMGAIYDALNIPEMKSPVNQLLMDTVQKIIENPGLDFDFKKIAKQNKISYYHFRRCFVQYAGIPLHEFVLQKRLMLAIDLLKKGEKSVKEIADCCGFHTSSDFSRFIKERSGFTPSEWKKQQQSLEI